MEGVERAKGVTIVHFFFKRQSARSALRKEAPIVAIYSMNEIVYRVGQKEVHRDYRLVRLNGTCQIYDFLHKGSTEGGKTDASELGQDNVKYQGKYVLCRYMHFGHITAGN